MACSLTRDDVSEIVLKILRDLHNDESITEFSRFGTEIQIDPIARATLYPPPITSAIENEGCLINAFGPSACEKAQDIEDIVSAVWKDLKAQQSVT